MCFSVIAGKNATIDGHCLLGVNNDWTGYPGTIHFSAAKATQTRHQLVSGQYIPNEEQAFAYIHTATSYDTGVLKNNSWWGGVNENKVAVGMQGVYSFQAHTNVPKTALQADDIPILLLQRASSARQGVELIGALIDEYGFTVSSIDNGAGVCNVSIVDPDEGFFLEIAPGGYWVAKRVHDDHIEVRPNCFGTQDVDVSDQSQFIVSQKLKEHFSKAQTFNFYREFSAVDSVSTYYGTAEAPENALRKWHSLQFFAQEDIALNEMKYWAKPTRKVSVRDIMDLLSHSSEGTKYDLSMAPEAGCQKNPFWMDVSTSVGQAGTVFSSVFQFNRDLPSEIGVVAWFSLANSHLSPFIPHYFASEGLPKAYQVADFGRYDANSAWWLYQELAQLCYRDYQKNALDLVIPAFREFENRLLEHKDQFDQLFFTCYTENEEKAKHLLQGFSHAQAGYALEKTRELIQIMKTQFY